MRDPKIVVLLVLECCELHLGEPHGLPKICRQQQMQYNPTSENGVVDNRQQASSYLDGTTGLLHFIINIKELPRELVHLDGVLEGVSQKVIVMSHLQ